MSCICVLLLSCYCFSPMNIVVRSHEKSRFLRIIWVSNNTFPILQVNFGLPGNISIVCTPQDFSSTSPAAHHPIKVMVSLNHDPFKYPISISIASIQYKRKETSPVLSYLPPRIAVFPAKPIPALRAPL